MLRNYKKFSARYFKENKWLIIRFLGVGILNTLFSLCVYWVLVYVGIDYALAILFANGAGVLFNFKTIGLLVFKNSDNKLIFMFILAYAFIYLFSLALLRSLFYFTPVNKYMAAVIIAPPMAVLSFILNRQLVFR